MLVFNRRTFENIRIHNFDGMILTKKVVKVYKHYRTNHEDFYNFSQSTPHRKVHQRPLLALNHQTKLQPSPHHRVHFEPKKRMYKKIKKTMSHDKSYQTKQKINARNVLLFFIMCLITRVSHTEYLTANTNFSSLFIYK